MKVKKVQGIVCLVVFLLFANQAWAAEWVLCASPSSGARLYYDKSSIKKMDKDIIRVSNKFVYNSKSEKKNAFSTLKEINKAPKNPDIMSYDLSVNEIDCANKKHRLISVIFYDIKGKAIYSSSEFSKEWNKIISESFMDKLENTVCSDCKNCKSEKK
jgi:hypothetical protein